MSQSQQSSESEQGKQEKQQAEKVKRKQYNIMPISQMPQPNSRIVINLSLTHYDIIEDVADQLGWKIQYKQNNGSWDVLWTDHQIQPQLLIRMHLFQKVSHFPGIHVLARKNLLGISFMEMAKKVPTQYNFFPKTWLLPSQYGELRHEFEKEEKKTFIVKPEADCQGRGIFLTQKIQDLQNGKHYVVQQYLTRPFLVDKLKFDFRVYVLLCGVNPLRLYIYEQGLARFATETYAEPSKQNLKNQYMHLTNYAINKKSPKFIFNTSVEKMHIGHKRALTSVFKLIKRQGFNLDIFKQKLYDVIIKTFIVGHPLVAHQYRFCQPEDQNRNMCYHILGIDIMIDQNCNPFVLEVNHTPSFVADTPLDYHIKYDLIRDTLVLMNINPQERAKAVERMNQIQKERNISRVKRQLYENYEKQEKVRNAQEMRDKYEEKNIGKFTKIYPCKSQQRMRAYHELLQIADKSFFSENNVLRCQMEKEKIIEELSSNDKAKKTISNEQPLSPIKGIKKAFSYTERASQIFEKSSEIKSIKDQMILSTQPKIKFKGQTKPRLNSFKSNFNDLNKLQKDMVCSKTKIDLKSSNSIQLNAIKNQQPSKIRLISKNLPKINSEQPSPTKKLDELNDYKQQNQYLNYRKKKVAWIKKRQMEQNEIAQATDQVKDQKSPLKQSKILSMQIGPNGYSFI